MATWTHLIRFKSGGNIYYGNAIFPEGADPTDVVSIAEQGKLQSNIIEGNTILIDSTIKLSGRIVTIDKLLSPLSREQVPIIRCIGLNYMKHIKEGGRTPPPYPSLFIKPATSLAPFDAEIAIPKIAQETLDYEGELTIVIGRPARDVTEDESLDYVAGYITGNDLSCRIWQRDPQYAGNVPQWCFSKGYDNFAPVGPMIVSPKVLGAADNLSLKTIVNGEVRQDSETSDLLFGVRKIVSFLSQGTTLETGTLIMTGTPAGVAMGMKPPKYLKDGDEVEVRIGGLGSLKNKLRFDELHRMEP
ncbi:fumarylacetoacetate hydrolase [Xylogone sp. PMI_703]|nr:fumarylacetoacetate hydrolase [Xylogone sp. PMI_703]